MKRYSKEVKLSEHEDGIYVLYTEHEKLEEKYLKAGEIAENLRDDNTILTHRIAELKQQADADKGMIDCLMQKCGELQGMVDELLPDGFQAIGGP